MVEQATLFGPGPRARPSDPATSKAAAESLTADLLGRECRRVLSVLADLGAATAWDVTARLGPYAQRNCTARRITDLCQRGLVIDSGGTRTGPTGRPQIVWQITDEGRGALA